MLPFQGGGCNYTSLDIKRAKGGGGEEGRGIEMMVNPEQLDQEWGRKKEEMSF